MNALITIIINIIVLAIIAFINYKFYLNLNTHQNNLSTELEKLKTELTLSEKSEEEKLNQKRDVYISLINTMSIFVDGRTSQEEKDKYIRDFLNDYDTVWLWGNEDVILALSYFLRINHRIDIGDPHEAYANVILEMRRDLGLNINNLSPTHYEFIKPPKID